MADPRSKISNTSNDLLRLFRDKDKRLSKDDFIAHLNNYLKLNNRGWGKIDLSKVPLRATIKIQAIQNQAYEDYLTICAYFDEDKIAISSYIGPEVDNTKAYVFNFFNLKLTDGNFYPNEKNPNANVDLYIYQLYQDKVSRIEECATSQKTTLLIEHISNTSAENAINILQRSSDVNKYSIFYLNNALLLALSKGWNHFCSDVVNKKLVYDKAVSQQLIIRALLNHPSIDVNCFHLENGMTPLHIACLRGDSVELIHLLLEKGASITAQDYAGKTPLDYLDIPYENVRMQVARLTGSDFIATQDTQLSLDRKSTPPNELYTATLPTPEERMINIIEIKKIITPSPAQGHQASM